MLKSRTRLTIILILLFAVISTSFIYLNTETKRCGDDTCETGENTLFCPQDCKTEPQPLNAIGRFTTQIEETDTHNIYLLKMNYKGKDTAYIQGPEKQIKIAIPKTHTIDMDSIYDIAARGPAPDIKAPYYADTIEAYDEITLNYPNFYDPCWDYECRTKTPPWPKITPPVKRLFLSNIKGAENKVYTKGARINKPLLAKGKIDIAVVFVYDESPIPNETISVIKGITNTTPDESFTYVPQWYKEKAQELFGNKDIINLSINFIDTQLKLPDNLRPKDLSSCTGTDFSDYIREKLPETKSFNILVQFYYASEKGQRCVPHPIQNTGSGQSSVFLFTRPEFLSTSPLQPQTTSLAHELAHLFGATDKYTGEAEFTAGIEQCCWINTENPDETSGIMCHRVHKYAGKKFGCYNPPLSQLLITETSAKEMGWHDMDGDGYLEVEDPCPLDKDNVCITHQ